MARGDGKIYIVTETLSVLTGFALNVACYHLWGLAGLGVAFCLWYAAYCLIVGVVYFRRYGYSLSRQSSLLSLFTYPCLPASVCAGLSAIVNSA